MVMPLVIVIVMVMMMTMTMLIIMLVKEKKYKQNQNKLTVQRVMKVQEKIDFVIVQLGYEKARFVKIDFFMPIESQ